MVKSCDVKSGKFCIVLVLNWGSHGAGHSCGQRQKGGSILAGRGRDAGDHSVGYGGSGALLTSQRRGAGSVSAPTLISHNVLIKWF